MSMLTFRPLKVDLFLGGHGKKMRKGYSSVKNIDLVRASLGNLSHAAVKKRQTWQEKTTRRHELQGIKLKERTIKQERIQKLQQKRKDSLDRKRRREENERKASTFQVVTNLKKIKQLTKARKLQKQ